MCGIYGSTIQYPSNVIKEKVKQLSFRGPDNLSIKQLKSNLIFGHTRLSIIDPTNVSNQPLTFDDITIVFNGEIYNYIELKKQYLNNVTMHTNSDTEVICALYKKFGTYCVKLLNGMFSFVIYDHTQNILFGARDRLGKKPFYYHYSNRGFEFASQLKSLLINNSYTVNPVARQMFLSIGRILDPYTIINEVHKLEAGNYFTLDLSSNKLSITKYWDIVNIHNYYQSYKITDNISEIIEQFDELLDDAVKIRLRSDVPIGIAFSGGVDSTLISIFAQKYGNIKNYCIGFNDDKLNELPTAKIISDKIGVELISAIPTDNDIKKIFDTYIDYFDEPFNDDSFIPSLLLSKMQKDNGITVALDGTGGDELFFGYSHYANQNVDQNILRYCLLNDYVNIPENLINFNKYDLIKEFPYNNYLFSDNSLKVFGKYDMKTYLVSLFTKTDRSNMANQVENRSPLTDYRLIELLESIPLSILYKDNTQKYILKTIINNYYNIPEINKPKQGFTPNLGAWTTGILKDPILSILSTCNISEIIPEINKVEFTKLLNMYDKNPSSVSPRLIFALFNYVNWYLTYIV